MQKISFFASEARPRTPKPSKTVFACLCFSTAHNGHDEHALQHAAKRAAADGVAVTRQVATTRTSHNASTARTHAQRTPASASTWPIRSQSQCSCRCNSVQGRRLWQPLPPRRGQQVRQTSGVLTRLGYGFSIRACTSNQRLMFIHAGSSRQRSSWRILAGGRQAALTARCTFGTRAEGDSGT